MKVPTAFSNTREGRPSAAAGSGQSISQRRNERLTRRNEGAPPGALVWGEQLLRSSGQAVMDHSKSRRRAPRKEIPMINRGGGGPPWGKLVRQSDRWLKNKGHQGPP